MKTKIKKVITELIYDADAKPRKTFTDGSPLDAKLKLINDATDSILKIMGLDDNTIMVNAVEVASELAKEKMCDALLDDYEAVYGKDPESTTYTEEAQEIFDEYYDEFYALLINSN